MELRLLVTFAGHVRRTARGVAAAYKLYVAAAPGADNAPLGRAVRDADTYGA